MATKVERILAETLGIGIKNELESITPDQAPAVLEDQPEPKEELTDDATEDYTLARKTYKNLIDNGTDAINNLKDIAKATEHPRDYEVLATLIKSISDTTKDMYDIHKKTKELKENIPNSRRKVNTDNAISIDKAVFVGSPSEMLDKIRNQK